MDDAYGEAMGSPNGAAGSTQGAPREPPGCLWGAPWDLQGASGLPNGAFVQAKLPFIWKMGVSPEPEHNWAPWGILVVPRGAQEGSLDTSKELEGRPRGPSRIRNKNG